MPKLVDSTALLAQYRRGESASVGRQIFEALPVAARVPWAGRVLRACAGAIHEPVPPEVDEVLALTASPSRWRDGHTAFGGVRLRTLDAARGTLSPQLAALLHVAELVAKVTYNASGEPAPFDADSGWRLGPAAMALSDCLAEPDCEVAIWTALTVAPARKALR